MNVAVNAIPLTNIQTGIGRYLRCLYMEIARSYPEIDLRFFDGRRLLDRMPCSPGERGLWSARTLAMWAMPEQLVAAGRTARLALREKRLQRFVAGCDMYHDSYLFPFDCGGRVATVFTLHDLSLVRHPELHPPERVRFFNAHFAQRLHKVRTIIVPSEFTRQEAVTLLGVDPERIVVIPEGYDHDLFKPCSALQGAAIKQKYGLPDRYLLFVGAHEPRKNIDLLLKARGLTRNTVPLVWAGWSGWGEQQHGDMLCLGYVPDHDLAGLYSGAAAFVYPSLYEGFGLPVLEAMACGCPVICSRTASLPEVAGDAALYCDPGNADELADCIDQAIEDTNVREAALLKGPKRAAGFSWQLAAQQTIEVFKNAASG